MPVPFAEASAPAAAYRLPRPTVGQVDAHPDAAFIWSVIMAVRQDMLSDTPPRMVPVDLHRFPEEAFR